MNFATDISSDFVPDRLDSQVLTKLLRYEATPRAIRFFSNECHKLTDYGYWFGLGTLWVNYTGWSDLKVWRRLFSSSRPKRETSLMKPSELRVWRALPESLVLYRAHRPGETDWMSYAIDPVKAAEFARRRGGDSISEYKLEKSSALCLFLRRGETEVLAPNPSDAMFVRHVRVVIAPAAREAVPA